MILKAIEFCGFYPCSLVDRILYLKTSYITDKKISVKLNSALNYASLRKKRQFL